METEASKQKREKQKRTKDIKMENCTIIMFATYNN